MLISSCLDQRQRGKVRTCTDAAFLPRAPCVNLDLIIQHNKPWAHRRIDPRLYKADIALETLAAPPAQSRRLHYSVSPSWRKRRCHKTAQGYTAGTPRGLGASEGFAQLSGATLEMHHFASLPEAGCDACTLSSFLQGRLSSRHGDSLTPTASRLSLNLDLEARGELPGLAPDSRCKQLGIPRSDMPAGGMASRPIRTLKVHVGASPPPASTWTGP